MSKNSFKKRVLYNLIFLTSLAFLFFLIISAGKEFLNIEKIDDEIRDLNQEIVKLENKNIELSELLKYFNSESFVEKKARTEMGLKKSEEKVVDIMGGQDLEKTILETPKKENTVKKSNLKSWRDYFFKNNK